MGGIDAGAFGAIAEVPGVGGDGAVRIEGTGAAEGNESVHDAGLIRAGVGDGGRVNGGIDPDEGRIGGRGKFLCRSTTRGKPLTSFASSRRTWLRF